MLLMASASTLRVVPGALTFGELWSRHKLVISDGHWCGVAPGPAVKQRELTSDSCRWPFSRIALITSSSTCVLNSLSMSALDAESRVP